VSGRQPLFIILPRPVRIEILGRIARQLGGIHDRNMPTERQCGTLRRGVDVRVDGANGRLASATSAPPLARAGASRAGYNPSAQAGNNFCGIK
jgi:hypothetical protein